MMRPARILYVTITNWGVGDDAALAGAIRVMDEALPGHLKFFGDKNPEIAKRPDKPWRSDLWPPEKGDCRIDLIVHAGGCSWSGEGHKAWEEYAIAHKTPSIYLGVGLYNSNRDDDRTRAVLKHCPLFIGRDDISVDFAAKMGATNAIRVCCPSLFLGEPKPLGDKVGLVYQAYNEVGPHSCGSPALDAAQVKLFRAVLAQAPALVICHFIRDFTAAREKFPEYGDQLRYSRILGDYLRWYEECSAVLTMRFHGAYIAAALGRPAVCLKVTKEKSKSLKYIGVPTMHPDDVKALPDAKATDLFQSGVARAQMHATYSELLGAALSKLRLIG